MKLIPQLLWALALVNAATAQISVLHTFTPPPAGSDIIWPASILDTESLYPGNGISPGINYQGMLAIENEMNNPVFFDDDYVATGNAPNIGGNALWGNPRSGLPLGDPSLFFDFDNFFTFDVNENPIEEVTLVSFDFAWASSYPSANLGSVHFRVEDSQGNIDFFNANLTQTFNHGIGGSGVGRYGHVEITVGSSLSNIQRLEVINLGELDPGGFIGEFAIDNLRVNSSGGPLSEVVAVNSNGQPVGGYGTNGLKVGGSFSISDNVFNGGSEATTFSVLWSGSDPLIYQPQPFENHPIEAGETIFGAISWEVDTDVAPSGTYSGEFNIVNNGNPADPDDIVTLVAFELFDPPILTDNEGNPLTVGNQATISNQEVESHDGALRASVWITGLVRSNPRFTVTGMAVADVDNYSNLNPALSVVLPGGSLSGNIGFNSAGAASGTHTGFLRIQLEMNTPAGYLNNRQSVDDRVWPLSHTVPTKPSSSPSVTAGQSLGDAGADISGINTGAALIAGTSSTDQIVSLSFNESPPVSNPSGYGSAFGIDFGTTAELYVLQISYNDLPPGYAEQDLRIQVLDSPNWVPAISLNGNGGTPVTGAAPFAGSYAAYLTGLGGGVLDVADLGAYGVDPASNTVWIVLDYEGTFQLATGAIMLPLSITGVVHDSATNTTTITYQSQLGVSHAVVGGPLPDSLTSLGATAVGTGGMMTYTHQPAGTPSRFFYRFSKP